MLRFCNHFSNDKTLLESFINDFFKIVQDENSHFEMLSNRLIELGSFYGEYNVHDKLWNNCISTKDDITARVCIISLVQEARGLDAGPRLIKKLKLQGDDKSSQIIEKIVNDEVSHVSTGLKWFRHLCTQQQLDETEQFKLIVKKYLKSPLLPPFNFELRNRSGIPKPWYDSNISIN
jgi:uncharacterized ferritin-like protein (DUF455 family)